MVSGLGDDSGVATSVGIGSSPRQRRQSMGRTGVENNPSCGRCTAGARRQRREALGHGGYSSLVAMAVSSEHPQQRVVDFRLGNAVGQGVVGIRVDDAQLGAHRPQADPWERGRLAREGGLVVQAMA